MVGLRDIRQISVSGTVPDSYKQKTPATRLYLSDYGCKGTVIFLYLPSTYYVRVLVLSFSKGDISSRNFIVFFCSIPLL